MASARMPAPFASAGLNEIFTDPEDNGAGSTSRRSGALRRRERRHGMSALRKFDDDRDSFTACLAEAALVARLIGEIAPADGTEADPPLLLLTDLLPDSGGEIVLRPGGFDRRFRIVVPLLPGETGMAPPHVTAAGEDVTGLHFVRFEGGPVLYYPPDVELEFVLPGARHG
jgi:hypothetical protein